jgi:hypothetical protein
MEEPTLSGAGRLRETALFTAGGLENVWWKFCCSAATQNCTHLKLIFPETRPFSDVHNEP